MEEVRRRDDQELCGYVVQVEDQWLGLTVFHGVLGETPTRQAAETLVLTAGLASLADHWLYRAPGESDWQIALIQEARPAWVRLLLGYYSLPGVPTITVSANDLANGHALAWSRSTDGWADRIGGRPL